MLINNIFTVCNYMTLLSGIGLILFVIKQGIMKQDSTEHVEKIIVKKSNELMFTLKKYKECSSDL